MDSENQYRTDELAAKINRLKHVMVFILLQFSRYLTYWISLGIIGFG